MQENSHFTSDNATQVATQGVQKESAKAFNFSLVALVAVAVITAVFFALSTLTQSQISGKNDEISSIKSKISVIEADKKNIVASIIASNKLSPSVNLSKLLSDFRAVASKYQVAFQNFAIKNDEITTNLIVYGFQFYFYSPKKSSVRADDCRTCDFGRGARGAPSIYGL